MEKRVRIRPGDIIEFPVASGIYAYARVFEDCGYAEVGTVKGVR